MHDRDSPGPGGYSTDRSPPEETLQTDTTPHTAVSREFVYPQSKLNRDRHLGRPRQTSLAWGLLALVVVARVVSYLLLKADAGFTLVPRSFLGGGFHSAPALLPLVV